MYIKHLCIVKILYANNIIIVINTKIVKTLTVLSECYVPDCDW